MVFCSIAQKGFNLNVFEWLIFALKCKSSADILSDHFSTEYKRLTLRPI